jgi:hypothetical protein
MAIVSSRVVQSSLARSPLENQYMKPELNDWLLCAFYFLFFTQAGLARETCKKRCLQITIQVQQWRQCLNMIPYMRKALLLNLSGLM